MLGRFWPDSPSRRALSLSATALIALALAAPSADAATGAEGPLSAELEALATPAVATQPVPAQAEAVGLPAEGPGSLSREGGRVVVEARFEGGAISALEALQAAGAKVLVASRRYQTVALSIEPEDLDALAEVPGVGSVTPALRPVVLGAEQVFGTAAAPPSDPCEGGSVISQGVAQLNVPAARAAFGARGAGITVGVISDSFDSATTAVEGGPIAARAETDEATDDLPGPGSTCSGQQFPVDVIAEAPVSETSGHTDEGRAMLQVVHDIAPHAKLAFATALSSELEFARNIERLAEPVAVGGAGAKVIVDDVSYLSEPYYQDGPVAVAIQKVTEDGVTYLTAAGNENTRDALGRNIGSWEAPAYRPIACPAAVNTILGETSNGCMNFRPSGVKDPTFGIEVAPGGTALIDLQWAEPWFGVRTDLDAYLFDEEGQVLSDYKDGEGDIDNVTVGKPIELLGWKNKSSEAKDVFLVVDRCEGLCNPKATSAGTPRLKFEFVGHENGVTETEYPISAGGDVVGPTIYGHAGSAAAISVGAVRYTESMTAPREPEPYSSRGPVTHYYGPVLGSTAASALATPEVLAKPDVTATDCASTTFFARLEAGSWHFCGTSEAAPHAAAIAALMEQTAPLASPAAILAAMRSSATKFTPPSSGNSSAAVGAGLLNAAGALTALGGSPVDDPPSYVVPSPKEEVAVAPAPTVELTRKPAALTNESRPTFEFRAGRPVAFTCQIDGGPALPCASPYVVPTPLGQGGHGFVVTGTDPQGRSGSTGPYDFTVDTRAPKVTIVGRPKKLVRTKKADVVAHFRLKASESPVTFYCQIDREPLRMCGAGFRRRFTEGPHTLKVKAKDAAGNLTTRWAVYRFRVKLLRPSHPEPPRRSRRSGG